MKVAIITGISSQDGCYLAKLLLDKKYKVVGILRDSSKIDGLKYLHIDTKILIERLDLLNKVHIKKLVEKYQPDEIYNLAAQSSVGESYKEPTNTFFFNTMSVNNLLEVIKQNSNDIKLYQASSSEMYGHVDQLPITIDAKMNPVNPYGVSKMAAYFMVKFYRETYGVYACNGILFNHESVLRRANFFIKKVISAAVKIKNKEKKFLVVGNLNLKRDFGYSPCYVEAIWKMMQLNKPADVMVCSGQSIFLKDIVYYVFDYFGLSKNLIKVDKRLIREGEIYDIYGDNKKTKESLGWEYNTSFFDILNLLIEEELVFHKVQGACVCD